MAKQEKMIYQIEEEKWYEEDKSLDNEPKLEKVETKIIGNLRIQKKYKIIKTIKNKRLNIQRKVLTNKFVRIIYWQLLTGT